MSKLQARTHGAAYQPRRREWGPRTSPKIGRARHPTGRLRSRAFLVCALAERDAAQAGGEGGHVGVGRLAASTYGLLAIGGRRRRRLGWRAARDRRAPPAVSVGRRKGGSRTVVIRMCRHTLRALRRPCRRRATTARPWPLQVTRLAAAATAWCAWCRRDCRGHRAPWGDRGQSVRLRGGHSQALSAGRA